MVMGLAINLAAAVVLALSIAFYVFVYTMWLKRRTPQNIVIGGAAGAFPAVVGWAAVTGSVDLVPLILFAIVFFWTPPHFWSLALFANADYQRAGVPMLPVVAGARETRRQIVLYTLVLLPVSLVPWWIGFSGPVYGIAAVLLGAGFLFCMLRVRLRDRQDAAGVSLTGDAPARALVPLLYPLSVRVVRRTCGGPVGGVMQAPHGTGSAASHAARGRRDAPPPARPQHSAVRSADRAGRAVLRHHPRQAVEITDDAPALRHGGRRPAIHEFSSVLERKSWMAGLRPP